MSRSRTSKPRYELFNAPYGPLKAVTFQRWVKFEDGVKLCNERKARRVYSERGNFLHFQMIHPSNSAGSQASERTLKPSCTVLSRREAAAAAGLYGDSQTMGMTDEQRTQRMSSGLPPVDLVEAALVKLKAFEPVRA